MLPAAGIAYTIWLSGDFLEFFPELILISVLAPPIIWLIGVITIGLP